MKSLTSVLIVDDEPTVREVMARWVSGLGLEPQTAGNADEALEALRTHRCDLAVIDVMMPGHDGLWLASELQRDHPNTAVVIVTGYTELLDGDNETLPIADLLIKPFERDRFALAVDRGRRWRKQVLEEMQWHARLARELRDRTEDICGRLAEVRDGEAEFLVALAEERTPDTMAHAERVARYAQSVAREIGLEAGAIGVVEHAARFHDIGKMVMPESLLTKPSPLTPGELAIMRRHVDAGADLLAATETLGHVAPLVLASHEWFGGGGYPYKLAGEAIPLASRIVSVADAYDVMTQGRHYRDRLDSVEAVSELLRCANSQFDPAVLTAFLAVLGRH